MFPGLTQADIAKLSDEQREVIARVALDQTRTRQSLQEKAEGYAGYYLVPTILFVLMIGGTALMPGAYIPLVVFGSIALIQFHAAGIKKRIDATQKLMELLLEEKARSQESPAETLHERP